jgi:antitoxin component YwqK of YwqJK toxin-antitoxin module
MQKKTYEIAKGSLVIKDQELGVDISEKWDVPFLKDQKHTIEKDSQGVIERAYFKKDKKLHGEYLLYHVSGMVKGRSFYKDGILHGPSTFFSLEGLLLSSSWFYDGEPIGESKQYYLSGNLYGHLLYKDGKLHGMQRYFYENGDVKSEIPYQKGILHGVVRLFWQGGKLKRECSYHLGLKQGKEQILSSDGVILDEGVFLEGKPMGIHFRRYSNGKVKEEKRHLDQGKIERLLWTQEGKPEYQGVYTGDESFQETKWSYPEKKKQVREGSWDGKRIKWK